MENIMFLLFTPLAMAALVLVFRHPLVQRVVAVTTALALSGCTVLMLIQYFNASAIYYPVQSEAVKFIMLGIEVLLAVYIIRIGIRQRQTLISFLSLVSVLVMLWYELLGSHGHTEVSYLMIDKLSLLMIAIIAVVGSLIIVFTVPYLEVHHHHHHDQPSRIPQFLALLLVFLSAMFGIVLSDDLIWMFFFWELTTLCSYLLIRYPDSPEAHANACRALKLNLLGGLCFAGAIAFLGTRLGLTDLRSIIAEVGKADLIVPATLLAVAALTKSAQLPFSRWLLGAMVAPTPSSALLHSSTMVKAGVFLLIRISPMLVGNNAGLLVIIVGGLTFLMTSLMAIAQSDGKKVLAYSTLANLGLIVVCAGIGTYESLWAAAMLIVFHAVSKSLLFLSVGTTEHALGSRDIEDMHGLIVKHPGLGLVMVIGIAGMFLAPFGMLIAKWAALRAFIDAGHLYVVMLLVFGSAATLMYWTKWLGRLVAVLHRDQRITSKVPVLEWVVLYALSAMVVALCVGFPFVSNHFVVPFLQAMFPGQNVDIISGGNQVIMLMMLGMIAILPFGLRLFSAMDDKITSVYMAGVNEGDNRMFTNSMGGETRVFLSNWYLSRYFGEEVLLTYTVRLTAAVMLVMLVYTVGGGLWN